MSKPQRLRYRFDLPDGTQKQLDLHFDPHTARLMNATPAQPAFWTELTFNQCANCPLKPETSPHCPAAVHMAPAIEALEALVSYDLVGVTVLQDERTISVKTSAQQAMSSVLGLIMASSGCPWTDHLRPMARFHLPFASEAETLYRSVGMFLLARELGARDAQGGFTALAKLYENLHIVNRDMSRRLGAATRTDPARNALALLDTFTTLLPMALEDSLQELAPLFDAWKVNAVRI
jgi:hypothetical protein